MATSSFKTDLLGAIPSLRAFAVSLSQNADKADDLVQETLMKAWDKQSSFQLGTNLKAWLFTILRNEFYSQMRKRGREVQDSDGVMTARLAIHPEQDGMLDLDDFRVGARPVAAGSARGDHPDRRFGLFLRGSRRNLRIARSARSRAASAARARRLHEILGRSRMNSEFGPDAISTQVLGSGIP